MDYEKLRPSWVSLIHHWGVDAVNTNRTFNNVSKLYMSEGRVYHTLDHIERVLELVKVLEPHARDLPTIQLAAWLHDVIYDPKASDNEEQSAQFARKLCGELRIPVGDRVAEMILKTKNHDPQGDRDSQVLLDADLSVLGSTESEYENYSHNIRQEYAWVPEDKYRSERTRLLKLFLQRTKIFHYLTDLEKPARRNISAEIKRLEDKTTTP